MINKILLNIFFLFRYAFFFFMLFEGFQAFPSCSLWRRKVRRRIINLIGFIIFFLFLLYLKQIYDYDFMYNFQVMPFSCTFYYRVFLLYVFLLNEQRIRRVTAIAELS